MFFATNYAKKKQCNHLFKPLSYYIPAQVNTLAWLHVHTFKNQFMFWFNFKNLRLFWRSHLIKIKKTNKVNLLTVYSINKIYKHRTTDTAIYCIGQLDIKLVSR